MMNDWLLDFKILMKVYTSYIARTGWLGLWLSVTAFIIFVLQWLFNLDQLIYIIRDSGLDVSELLRFFTEAFLNIFRQIDDLTPISFVIIAVFQATAIVLLIRLRQSKLAKQQLGSLGVGLIGAACVACGGSLITPLLGLIASNVSVVLASSISDILLIAAVILSYRAATKLAIAVARSRL